MSPPSIPRAITGAVRPPDTLPTGARAAGTRTRPTRRTADDRGQATTEYGLVILVAGTIALGVIAWAGGTDAFTSLFDAVIARLMDG